MNVIAILTLSIVLQFAAAVLALRLVRVSGRRLAWELISGAIALMAVRRCITLERVIAGDVTHPPDLMAELVAMGISVLMLAGIALIAPLFSELRQTVDNFAATASRLEESEGRLQLAQQAAQIGTWEWDVRTNVTQFTDEQYRQLGLNPDDASPAYEGWLELVHPDDRQRCETAVQDALEGVEPFDIEYRVVLQDGTEKWLASRSHVDRDQDGSPLRMVGVNIDITARKEAEQALRKSEEQYRAMFELASVGMVQTTPTGQFIRTNAKLSEMFGYTADELRNMTFSQITHPDDRAADYAQFQQAVRGESPAHMIEKRYVRKDGKVIWGLANAVIVRDAQGQPMLAVAVVSEITERKLAEQALVESEDRFRTTFVDAPVPICLTDSHANFIRVNRAFCEWIGQTEAALLATDLVSATQPENVDECMIAMEQLINGEVNQIRLEKRCRFKPGELRIVTVDSFLLRDNDGQPVHFISHFTDITEQKEAEIALRKSEERFRRLAENVNAVFWMRSADGEKQLYVSPRFEDIWGLSLQSLRENPDLFINSVHPDDRPTLQAAYAELATGGRPEDYNLEYRITRPDGEVRWIHDRGFSILDDNEVLLHQAGFAEDITVRKQAESALLESRAKLRHMLDSLPDLIWMSDTSKACTWFNQSWLAFTGREMEQEVGNGWAEGVHPDDFDRCLKIYTEAFDRREPFVMEYRLRHHSGDYRWIYDAGQPMRTVDGEFEGYMGGCVDVHDRKLAEAELRESLTRQQLIIKSANIGLWDWDLSTNEVIFSPEWKSQLGYADDELSSKFEEWESRLHPDDREQALAATQQFLAGQRQTDYSVEFRLRHRDGSWRWILALADLQRNATGEPTRMMGCHVDITERRQAEDALHESEARYVDLYENAPDLMCSIVPGTGAIIRCNQTLADSLAYSKDEIIGRSVIEMYHPDSRAEAQRAFQLFVATGEVHDVEMQLMRRDSSVLDVSLNVSAIRDEQGRIIASRSVWRDITERKAAEDAVRKSEALHRSLLENAVLPITYIDQEGRVLLVNKIAAAQVGMLPEAMVGHTLHDYLSTEHADRALADYRRTLEVGQESSSEYPIDLHDGQHWFASVHKPVTWPMNGEMVVMSMAVDITARKVAERDALNAQQQLTERVATELEKARAELVLTTRLSMLGRIAAQIAHDLRNPLGAVRNAAYYLKGELRDAARDVRESIGLIEDELATCDTLIRNLLEVVRPREPDRRPVNVAQVVQSAFQRLHAPDKIELKLLASPDPFYVDFDPVQCRQLMDNLLSNALAAVKDAGRIEVSLELDDEVVLMRVHDSGPGVSADARDFVFDLLFTTKATGTGLGLVICRQIVEQHGGTIELEAQGAGGASFLIRVPSHA